MRHKKIQKRLFEIILETNTHNIFRGNNFACNSDYILFLRYLPPMPSMEFITIACCLDSILSLVVISVKVKSFYCFVYNSISNLVILSETMEAAM